jgi:voltage-gated potassium channel Kch
MKKTQNKKFTFPQYIRYKFDNMMTGGITPIIMFILTFVFLFALFFASVTYTMSLHQAKPPEDIEKTKDTFGEVIWQTWMHIIDQGTITGEYGWAYRLVMLLPTLFGLLLVATMVGLVTSRINIMLEQLRKGRSLVVEEGHIVILGWSNKIFSIIEELIKANANQYRASIVVLADKDKVEMQDEIAEKIDKPRNIKIICRTGNPIDLDDLNIVNLPDAKSIIIVSPDDHNFDTQNIKCILAILNHPNRKKEPFHIVAEIKELKNKEIANIVGGDELTLVISHEIIARLAVQTCLQSGLTAVYNRLLGFSHEEIYVQEIPELYNKTYHDAVFAFEHLAVMGIQRLTGIILLNPKETTKIKEGDKIIYIAEDDNEIPHPDIQKGLGNSKQITDIIRENTPKPKKMMMLGWNSQSSTIVREMDSYVAEGSELWIVADDIQGVKAEIELLDDFIHMTVHFQQGDITERKLLNDLNLQDFDNVMILSYSQQLPIQEADATTLVTLIHLRDIKRQRNANFTIVSEMLDIKNRTLAEIAKPDDFIISDHVISLIISQLAEHKDLQLVFNELFDSHGCEIYLKPVGLYLQDLENVNFYTVCEAAMKHRETAIGYRVTEYATDASKVYGVVLNPHKAETHTYKPEDKIIVLAENYG